MYPDTQLVIKKTPIHSCLTISCLNRPLLYLLSKQNFPKSHLNIRITIKGQEVIASKHYNCLKQKKRITTKSKIQVLQNKKNQVNDSNKL